MERFACGTEIISGKDALKALGEPAGERLALVVEPGLSGSGILRKITETAKPDTTALFDRIDPEPRLKQAVEGARLLRQFRADHVVALGGSHILDCAKAMVCFAGSGMPLTVIPMDFGTGTEVTESVGLFHEGRKHTFRDRKMRPARAILDEAMLEGMTGRAAGESGFLLLANSLQAYTARCGGMMTAMYAREAFVSGWAAVPAALSGIPAARERVLLASAMAGTAGDRAGLGLCHALGGVLESIFHIPEGRLAAILLPAVIGCNVHAAGSRYAELARAAGLGGGSRDTAVRNLKTGLIRLRRELGIPETLAHAGLDPRTVWRNIGRIVQMTLEDPECRNNPVTVDDFMIRRILEEVMGRY